MPKDEIPPGTLYLMILKTLARGGELHGFEIGNSIHHLSQDVLQVEEGSLYPALQRMLVKGWVTAKWGHTADNRRARYYRLTHAGRKQLEAELSQFERVIGAIQGSSKRPERNSDKWQVISEPPAISGCHGQFVL